MCFYTRGSRIRIATKDIVCYKRVIIDENCCFSLHQKFKYEYGQKYSGKSKWKLFSNWLFNFHIASEGCHSFIEFEVYRTYGLNYWQSRATVKCIIPKGSLYLINKLYGEYCSSSIIIKKPTL